MQRYLFRLQKEHCLEYALAILGLASTP